MEVTPKEMNPRRGRRCDKGVGKSAVNTGQRGGKAEGGEWGGGTRQLSGSPSEGYFTAR